jgi:two-component system sensor histidine kinase RegB
MNPLSVIYLVEITFAAVTLGHRWAVLIALLSNVAYGLTFFYSHPLVFTDPGYSGRVMTLHLWGMWMALAAASGLIAHFVSRVSEALERRDAELTQLRAAAARGDRLAALLSLGAGAAHELATPLSTISTAAHELVRHLQGSDPSSAHGAQYAAIIRGEVERCRIVIDRLSGRAPSTAVDGSDLAFQPLVDEIRYRVGDSLAQRLDVTCPQTGVLTGIPAEPLRQTLVALVRNAFDASAQDQRVGLAIERSSRMVSFNVVDRGRGMTTDEAAHAGEPFFTTKPAGMGLGMGLFLARSFAAQMGGTLEWSSVPDRGTSVVLRLPIQEAP